MGGSGHAGSPVRKRVVVTGLVQGVFYRASLRDVAARLGVAGFARNATDGSVIAELEGEPGDVSEAIAFCRAGPRQAIVEDVTVTEMEPTGATGFRIG